MKIDLSLEERFFDGTYSPASLTIEADGDSHENPPAWVWFMFAHGDGEEPWIKLTYKEAEQAKKALGEILDYWVELGRPEIA